MNLRLQWILAISMLSCGVFVGCGNNNSNSSPAALQLEDLAPENIDYSKCAFVEPGNTGPMTFRNPTYNLHANIIGGLPLSQDTGLGSEVVAVISHPSHDSSTESICTGSLIAPNLVLTAAHCFQSESDYAEVSFSRSPFCADYYGDTSERRMALQIRIHSGYNGGQVSTEVNDVAMILLDQNAPENANIMTLEENNTSGATSGSDFLYGVGYGRTVGTTSITTDPPELHGGVVDLATSWSNREDGFLKQVDPGLSNLLVISNAHGAGICHGDSGGPLVISEGGILRQIGIALFVLNAPDGDSQSNLDQCGSLGAYLKIHSVQAWLKETTENLEAYMGASPFRSVRP